MAGLQVQADTVVEGEPLAAGVGHCVARPGGPQQLLVLQPHAVVQPHSVRLHFRHGHKDASEKIGHACFQFRTPRGQLRKNRSCLFPVPNSTRAAPKKSVMPVSSSELHVGSSEKIGHACFQFRTPRGQQPKNGWCLFPAAPPDTPARRVIRIRSYGGGLALVRATCPASKPPACRACAKVRILPRNFFQLSPHRTTGELFFQLSCGPLSKVSANLPGRAAPARRHGGTQLMSRITNYEAVSDYVGDWLHRAQCLAFDRFFRSSRVSHCSRATSENTLVRAWCGPRFQGHPRTVTRTCGNLCRRGVGAVDAPTGGGACEGVLNATPRPKPRSRRENICKHV